MSETSLSPAASPQDARGPSAWFYGIAFVVLILDQWTKWIVVTKMWRGQSIDVLGSFFRLTYVRNDGAAFGLDLGGRWSFVAVTILVAAFIVFYYWRSERTPTARWGMALILGGALGNLADRIRLGEVVDFLHLSVAGFSWPIFNVADIGVTVGVGLLALHLFRDDHHTAQTPETEDNAAADPGGDPAREPDRAT